MAVAVSKDKNFGGKWIVTFRYRHADGRVERIRRVSPVQNRRGAEQYERELRQAVADGRYVSRRESRRDSGGVPTVAQFTEQWLRDAVRVHNKPSSVTSKESMLRLYILPFFGSTRLDAVSTQQIDAFVGRQSALGLSQKTINNQVATISRMLRQAEEWGMIRVVPKTKKLTVPPPEFDFLTFDEAARLTSAAADVGPQWGAMVSTCLKSGLRIGELLALRWSDLDLSTSRLSVRQSYTEGVLSTPKSGKGRDIPLPASAVECLSAWRAIAPASEYVFPRDDGSIASRDWTKPFLRRACTAADLRQLGWHALRHTYASHLAMRGVPIKVIQELLGHSDLDMTMRYAHLLPATLSEAVSVLDGFNGAEDLRLRIRRPIR